MHILKEGDAHFTSEELAFLRLVESDKFPWFFARITRNFYGFAHGVMKRSDEPSEGFPCSPFYEQTKSMLLRLCGDNGITIRTIYRMSFNITVSDPSKHSDPHVDHLFPHKNLLVYLNKFDEGKTFIVDDEDNVIETIHPAFHKFVVFDGHRHAQGFCRPQQSRLVFVATFDGDVA